MNPRLLIAYHSLRFNPEFPLIVGRIVNEATSIKLRQHLNPAE